MNRAGIYKLEDIRTGAFQIASTRDLEGAKQQAGKKGHVFTELMHVTFKKGTTIDEQLAMYLPQVKHKHLLNTASSLGLPDDETRELVKEEDNYYWGAI